MMPTVTPPASDALPEDATRLFLAGAGQARDTAALIAALRRDDIVLVQGLADQEAADQLITNIASALGLLDRLKVQAAFASIQGHRDAVGQYFMTVNRRGDYQFIPPHSEGVASVGIQLGSFYCRRNTTDGGENLLFNTDGESSAWSRLREVNAKADLGGRQISCREAAMLRTMHGIALPGGELRPGAEIVGELPHSVPGIRLCNVLEPVQSARSQILDRDVRVLWDNVVTFDFDCAADFMRLLQSTGMLRLPPGGAGIGILDVDHRSHVWRSGVRLAQIFTARITHRLAAGEMLLFNNLTWAHATANWTPHSGSREVLAAFA